MVSVANLWRVGSHGVSPDGLARRIGLAVFVAIGLGALSANASAAALGGVITSVGLFSVLAVLMTAKAWSTQAPALLASKAGGLLLLTTAALLIWHVSVLRARRAPVVRLLQGSANTLPDDVDPTVLTNELRSHFFKVQAHWDDGDLDALESLVLPDLLEELDAQRHGYVGSTRRSEIVVLNTNILAYERQDERELVCVEFTGVMRDGEADGNAERTFGELRMLLRTGGSHAVWKLARQQTLL